MKVNVTEAKLTLIDHHIIIVNFVKSHIDILPYLSASCKGMSGKRKTLKQLTECSHEINLTAASFSTNITTTWFLSCVDSHVSTVFLALKIFFHWHHRVFFSCVDSPVSLQKCLMITSFTPNITTVWFLSCVNSHVPLIFSPCGKIFHCTESSSGFVSGVASIFTNSIYTWLNFNFMS